MSEHQTPETGVPTCYRHPGRESYIRCQRCDRPICPDCMRDAAVGFQCPSCIAEGKKTTRSGRTAYGGLRPGNAAITSMVLIGINVAVWLAILASGGSGSRLVDALSLRARGLCAVGTRGYAYTHDQCSTLGAGHWLPGVSDGAWWQPLTSMFTHVEPLHIGFNMLALWVLGPQLELAIGRVRFLALYLVSGLAGSALVYWAAPEYVNTLGASGAVFGLMGALLVLALKVRANPQGILMWIGINFVFTFAGPGNISWQGHLGGFLGGVAIAAAFAYAPRARRSAWQAAGVGLVAVVVLVAIVARTVALG
ncbi:MAG: rhomboid family intramembrane serine protease [Nocardioides sp.]